MIGTAIVVMAASLSVALYLALSQRVDRAAVKETLHQIEHMDGDPESMRETALAAPLAQRVFLPMVASAVGLIRRFTPADYVAKIRHQLVLAGQPDPDQVDRYLSKRLLTLVAVPAAYFAAFRVLHLTGSSAWATVALCGAASVMGPSASLKRKIAKRRAAVQASLPDVLDLLTISVEAGLGFEQALDRTVAAVPGPLTEEMGRMLGEVRAGVRRADAMRALDERIGVPEMHSFTLAVLQADTFGISISRVLRSQADESRIRRRQVAQEKAQKAPVKMLIPMVFCIFPSLFVVVMGPAALNIFKNFK
ncbi:MAG: type II secretion system F family protein [Actinobacteria bacterium]|nr:type II secretion system F family protein [Actinomycetota bacterium]